MALNNATNNTRLNTSNNNNILINNNNNNNNNNNIDPTDSNKQGNLVVRIDQDSDNNLQALFDSVLKPGDSKIPLQVPFRMRKLPDSFFHPPSTGSKSPSVSHSRANSTDSAFSTGSQSGTGPNGISSNNLNNSNNNNNSNGGLANISATGGLLGTTGGGPPPQGPPPQLSNRGLPIIHSRAHSSPASLQQTYTPTSAGGGGGGGGGGGNNSNVGAVGSNNTGGGNGGNNQNNNNGNSNNSNSSSNNSNNGQPNTIQPVHMKQRSYDVVSAIQLQNELGDLPPGWEQARTPEGQIYYLNHITKTTQWEDPRTQSAQQQALTHQTLQQTVTSVAKESAVTDPLGTLPEGWEQATTASGEIYFINHINRTTSWFDPRISDYLQRASTLSSSRSEMNTSNAPNWANIRNLEKEREYLKQRQQEIQHQDLLTRQNQQTMGLQMDPFLSGLTDHTRQESGDSGLSISSNNFSVTPDFLSNIDDSMDCISESGNLDSISGLDGADDLVPSLQIGDNLCNEMLNDVQSLINPVTTKSDNLNWYKI